MKTVLNPSTLLWALGIIQPATSKEVLGVFSKILEKSEARPSSTSIEIEINKQIRAGNIMAVMRSPAPLYSLTYAGHLAIPSELRKLRDKTRLFLLHKSRHAKFTPLRGVSDSELAGASPALDTSTSIKEAAANNSSGRRPKWSVGQPSYWPRPSERFISGTGPKASPRNTCLPLLSFDSPAQLAEACGFERTSPPLNSIGIAIALGISPALVSQILARPERHYRVFELPKKGGGTRTIESPRIFLKTIQGFLADYVFASLKVHESVHSFQRNKSIVTNALRHENSDFVANIDIKDFFGSINKNAVYSLLKNNGLSPAEAESISSLCCKENKIPQGAPTSPTISNAVLFSFDSSMNLYCRENSLSYTRYADDITFSGPHRSAIVTAISFARALLKNNFGLDLNERKTRIAGRSGQQKVTGVVVNVQATPSRHVRREVRAMFHNALKAKRISSSKILEMAGYIGYFNSFPKHSRSKLLDRYKDILEDIPKRHKYARDRRAPGPKSS